MVHDSLGQGQELAVDYLVDKGTPKTAIANHCHTERRTRPGKPYSKKKRGYQYGQNQCMIRKAW